MLKQVVLDFYDSTQINTAKEMLANVLEELKPADWIAPRRRKESG